VKREELGTNLHISNEI